MPSVFIYLGVMLVVICIWFMLFKRPMYEAVFVSFLLLLTITGAWKNLWTYVEKGFSTSLLYSMMAFVAMSAVLRKTKIIESCIALILALLGRFRGGAAYVSVIASAFMGALSGSGPGNVMATGAITIPAMIRSGFPRHLAANIESNASYMGNMIPPSSNIIAAMGAFTALYPEVALSTGQFWLVLWSISLWFILQRIVCVWIFCKYYKVEAVKKEEIPPLKEVLYAGWRGFLLPLVILLPFALDYALQSTFFAERLGAQGAKQLSSSLLIFTAGIATLYACLITAEKKAVSPQELAKLFAGSVASISPAVGVCLIGYMIGALFADMELAVQMQTFIASLQMNRFALVLFLCALTCILGMVIPGSSLVVMFGSAFISSFAAVGVEPLLAAAMLPCICGVMCGITPPLGLGMYAGMSLAKSDFAATFKNNLWWVAAQYAMEVVVLMGWLPILGL